MGQGWLAVKGWPQARTVVRVLVLQHTHILPTGTKTQHLFLKRMLQTVPKAYRRVQSSSGAMLLEVKEWPSYLLLSPSSTVSSERKDWCVFSSERNNLVPPPLKEV